MPSTSPQSQGRIGHWVEVVVLGLIIVYLPKLLELLAPKFVGALETGSAPVWSAIGLLIGVPPLAWIFSVSFVRLGLADSIARRRFIATTWCLGMAPLLIVLQSIDHDPLIVQPWFSIVLYYASFGFALRMTRVPTPRWVQRLPLLRPRGERPRASRGSSRIG